MLYMDTQNDGEKVTPFEIWPFLVSMLVFGDVFPLLS